MFVIEEKVNNLVERAENHGLRLEFDSGFLMVKQMAAGDSEKQNEIIEELGKFIVHLRRLAEHRAIAARAKQFVGSRVLLPEYGAGRLLGSDTDGHLNVSIQKKESRSSLTLSASAKDLLIIVEGGSIPIDAIHESASPRRRLFGLV
jgi:hypothetical protein